MKKLIFVFILVAGASELPAQKSRHHHTAVQDTADLAVYGTASYYARKFDGRPTATGDIFSSLKYTAASNRLPLRTWVKVTNVRNQQSVMVLVNDRMHPKNKRLIDVSRVAARDLGFVGRGLARVKVEICRNYHPDVVTH